MNDEGQRLRERDLGDRTKVFALGIIRLFTALPKNEVARVLGRQVLRSGTSVGANYREANRARSKAEFISKIGDYLKESDETGYWLELLTESETAMPSRVGALADECNQLLAIFTTISKRAKANAA